MRSWISEFFSWGGACEPPARFFPWFNETEDLMNNHAQMPKPNERQFRDAVAASDDDGALFWGLAAYAALAKAEQDNIDKNEKIETLEQRLNDLRRDNGE